MINSSYCLIVILMFFSCSHTQENKIDFSQVESKHNVKIHYEYSEEFFPKSWLKPPICGHGVQIDSLNATAYKKIIDNSLSAYSKDFIKSNLKNIYLLKSMSFYNKNYGGTSSNSSVYLVSNGAPQNFLSARIHSEFSSILLDKYAAKFPYKKWTLLNESNFKYSGTGVEVLDDHDNYCQSEELLLNGFLVKYSKSSQENDFNMFVDWMFTKPVEILELCNKYEKIRIKYNIVKRFYNEIDSGVNFDLDITSVAPTQ